MSSLITKTAAGGAGAVAVAVGCFRLFGFARRSESATTLHGDGSLLIYRYKWNTSGIIPRLFTTRRAIVGGTRRERREVKPLHVITSGAER